MNDSPLLLVDFSNAAWRAAHSLKAADLTNGGESTAVLYGVLAEVGRVMQRFDTSKVFLCCDHPNGPTLRKAVYPQYKVKRTDKATPEEMEFRVNVIKGIITAKRIIRQAGYKGFLQADGYEADDLIAAAHAARPGQFKVVVSTDKDLYQLIDPETVVFRPGAKENMLSVQSFHRLFDGLSPADWVRVKALAGCNSDGVPGLRGVAEKTAVKAVQGTLTGKKMDAVTRHLATPEYERDLSLVRLPFDDRLLVPIRRMTDAESLTELMWTRACRAAGIKYLHYPRT